MNEALKGIFFALLACAAGPALAGTAVPSSGTASGAALPVSTAAAGPYGGMALVPAGDFLMGSDDKSRPEEGPRHRVYLDAFYMDKREVTAAQYRAFAEKTGRKMPRQSFPDEAAYPVVYVGWQDAADYCASAGKALPTEAQWEKAARGGSDGDFCFGGERASLGHYAWFWDNSGKRIHPVGLKKPNAYGLYDMHGNVLEWTADWYGAAYYASSPYRNPAGPSEGKEKVFRGGSVFVSPELCRSSVRMKSSPFTRYSVKGFRCAAPLPAAK